MVFCPQGGPDLEIILVRHGAAVDASPPHIDDNARYLTDKGRRVTAAMAPLLADPPVDLFLTSPLVRAVQTAEILVRTQPEHTRVEVLTLLAGGVSPLEVLRDLRRYRHETRLALVGHEPMMGDLMGLLLGRSPISFRKSGVAVLRLDSSRLVSSDQAPLPAQLVWAQFPDGDRITTVSELQP